MEPLIVLVVVTLVIFALGACWSKTSALLACCASRRSCSYVCVDRHGSFCMDAGRTYWHGTVQLALSRSNRDDHRSAGVGRGYRFAVAAHGPLGSCRALASTHLHVPGKCPLCPFRPCDETVRCIDSPHPNANRLPVSDPCNHDILLPSSICTENIKCDSGGYSLCP